MEEKCMEAILQDGNVEITYEGAVAATIVAAGLQEDLDKLTQNFTEQLMFLLNKGAERISCTIGTDAFCEAFVDGLSIETIAKEIREYEN